MCGIVGIKYFGKTPNDNEQIKKAVNSLSQRGPDSKGIFVGKDTVLGHTRLSILDTSANGNQPMLDSTGRYVLIFNGEIYNYQDLKKELSQVSFTSGSDTEVLLHLLIQKDVDCLDKLNGFFSFAFYNKETGQIILARDRMGIKPLHYFADDQRFIFSSELKALMTFGMTNEINKESLYWYLKLNYLPGEMSMIKGVRKLSPGHFLTIKEGTININCYSEVQKEHPDDISYPDAKSHLVDLLDASVRKRLMADVPLGSFLSGGTDSSAVVALASKHHPHLSTFSIGYRDHPFFDETVYAELVAKKFNTNHTPFLLTNDDLLNDIDNILAYIDEPFGDSSAIPTHILSKHVKRKVKVALSGDGADELFGGYYKHLALNKSLSSSLNFLTKNMGLFTLHFPQSRSSKWANMLRRINRFAKMSGMSSSERYWFLASLTHDPSTFILNGISNDEAGEFKTKFNLENPDLTDYLIADQKIVLPGDMLHKIDLMSMANSLEVRVPFLDKDVVSFANSLPASFKIKGNQRKRILADAFRNILPEELYNRPKKGFEVPLLSWMRNELLEELDGTLFNRDYLAEQHLFVPNHVILLRKKLLSKNPQDVHGIIWALFVFQKWYKRYLG